ncbi:ABC transporter ATP-binding protein [Clostridia bacterium]|nr:ABC transporter ATP-binding protein [Clostridia bacterium]
MDKEGNFTKVSNFKVFVNMVKYVYKLEKKLLIYGFVQAVTDAVAPYITIFLSANILDSLSAGKSFTDILIITVTGLALIFAMQITQNFIGKKKNFYTDIAIHNFEMENTNKIFDFDYEKLDSPATNKIRDRIRQDNNWGNGIWGVFYGFPGLLSSIFGFIAAIVVLIPLFANKDFWGGLTPLYLAAIVIVVLTSILIQTKILIPKMQKLFAASSMMEYFWNFLDRTDYKESKDIRIYNADDLIKNYTERGSDKFKQWTKKFARIGSAEGILSGLRGGIIQGGVYVLVVMRAVAGALTVGSVIKYSAAIINFINGISGILGQFNEFVVASRRQQSTLEYLNIPNEMHKGTLPVEKRDDNEYEIEFKNVSFKYPGSENYALKNLSMKFKIGQRLAVVGMNGSGKTTMIKLLCRLYDPTDGEITLNGFDIKKYDYDEYMSVFSVVFQDFKLFSFPLGQNVAAYTDCDSTKAQECLKMAGLGERLDSMPKGLSTSLYKDFEEDGVEISGGEAQKIALARALYKDAPFIVLDEPTAALDPIAEFEVYSKFNGIVGGKTAIYISHRLSSCRFCDDIAVFHEGELIQRGSHDSLIADESGKYNELWNAQAQYYDEKSESEAIPLMQL